MTLDFTVVGGGSAGYAAARTAAALGLKTAVVDGAEELGGLCILRGCMPSKTLLESAHRFRVLRRAREFGLDCGIPTFDALAIRDRKRRFVAEFAEYRRSQLTSGKFELYRGRAEFLGPGEVEIQGLDGSRSRLSSKTFLIATGSRVSWPAVPGLRESGCLTSDDLLESGSIPRSLIVLGAGAVGLEMASYCAAFGSRVTVIQRGPRVLTPADPDVSTVLEGALRHEGLEIHTGTRLLQAGAVAGGFRVDFEKNGQRVSVKAERLLNALGREPALEGLEMLKLERKGKRLAVDRMQRTSCPGIFAAGDVCAELEVVHVAIQQGETAARNAARQLGFLSGGLEEVDTGLPLFAVFSEPSFAMAGCTEAALQARDIAYESASYPFNDHGKSLVMGETHGLVKLLAEKRTGRLLGGAVVGPEAPELIHEIAVALRFGATARDLAAIPHYHPTLSEIWTYPAEDLSSLSPVY